MDNDKINLLYIYFLFPLINIMGLKCYFLAEKLFPFWFWLRFLWPAGSTTHNLTSLDKGLYQKSLRISRNSFYFFAYASLSPTFPTRSLPGVNVFLPGCHFAGHTLTGFSLTYLNALSFLKSSSAFRPTGK